MLNKIAPYLLFVIYKLLYWSWRIDLRETEDIKRCRETGGGFIFAHWHGDELGILHLLKKYNVSCIISTSKDGELMNKVVQLLGAETTRGSSTRGGASALKGIIRLVQKGRRPSVAVDGPKGPIYKVKPGVFQISRLSQLPIIPISFHTSNGFVFEKSWNKSVLPLPFSRVTICIGETMQPVSKDWDAKSDDLSLELERLINQTKDKAKLIGSSHETVY